MYTSNELAVALGKSHSQLLRGLDIIMGEVFYTPNFEETTYMNGRGKTYRNYTITPQGLQVMAVYMPALTKGETGIKYAKLLVDSGIEPVVVVGRRDRGETEFYFLLKEFLRTISGKDVRVVREYSVGKYRIDFYIPILGMIIEFDESYHRIPAQKKRDEERMAVIVESLRYQDDGSPPQVVRVDAKNIGEGIGRIAAGIHFNNGWPFSELSSATT